MDITLVANKKFTMNGVPYEPGDSVDISDLSERKVQQFLNQRLLRPSARALEQIHADAGSA